MVDWNFTLLESLITDRGDRLLLETAIACPCRGGDAHGAFLTIDGTPTSRLPGMSCPLCFGDGFIYRNPRVVTGMITAISSQRNLLQAGYALPGDCVFSPSIYLEHVSDFDRVTFPVPDSINDGQIIIRGAAYINENAALDTDLAINEDRLWYLPAQSIWCEDQDGVVYQEGTDFVFTAKKISWVGNSPDKGVTYTIKYLGYPEWICYASPMDRFDRTRNLGQKVLLRKKHVAFLRSSANNTPNSRIEDHYGRTKL